MLAQAGVLRSAVRLPPAQLDTRLRIPEDSRHGEPQSSDAPLGAFQVSA